MEKTIAKKDLIKDRGTMRSWLKNTCGYATAEEALAKCRMFDPPAGGTRSWLEVPHATTGATCKLFLGSKHNWNDIASYGLDVDVLLIAPNGVSSRLEDIWVTSEPSQFEELESVGTLAGLLGKSNKADNTGDLLPDQKKGDDLPF